MYNKLQAGKPFNGTATHATAAAVTITAVTGRSHYVTDVEASSDKAGSILTIKDGTTVKFQVQVGADSFRHMFQSPIRCTAGAVVLVEIDGTSACKANVQGFTVKP